MASSRHASTCGWVSALLVAACGGARAIPANHATSSDDRAPRAVASAPPDDSAPTEVAPNTRTLLAADSAASADRAPPASPSTSNVETAPPARPLALSEPPVSDEPIYFPGTRPRPKGSAVEASLDDEIVATWNRGGLSAEPSPGPKGRPAHAAPRVKVDVIDVRGDASEAEMQRVARLKSYWPFRICYEQGLRRMQKLHGTIKLRLTIGPSGRPSGVQQLAAELGDAAVVSCVVKSAMGLGLPAPSSGAPQVTLDISLWPGDEPVSVKSALYGKNALPANAVALTEQLRTHLSDVRACYAAGLARHDGLWGRLALAVHIASGTIDEAHEVESRFPDAEVTECVKNAFVRASVPATEGDVTIVYPLRLGRAPDRREARH